MSRDLREVAALLARLLEHLIKIESGKASIERAHWNAEAIHLQASAAAAYAPSMRRLLDLDTVGVLGAELPPVT